jgi:hypothetical protein
VAQGTKESAEIERTVEADSGEDARTLSVLRHQWKLSGHLQVLLLHDKTGVQVAESSQPTQIV